MIDIAAKRAANRARLLGEKEPSGKKFPYTTSDATNPEVCWDIISLCTRKEQIKKKGRGGSEYLAETKNLAFPELTQIVTVGERQGTTKPTKNSAGTLDKVYNRTNIKTMDEMYSIRNSMNKHAIDDVNDDYIEYFTSVVEVLDTYAQTVVADMIEADGEFLDKVNRARGCK